MKKLIFAPVLILCLFLINNVVAKELEDVPSVNAFNNGHPTNPQHSCHHNGSNSWAICNHVTFSREGNISRAYMNKLAGWINEERKVIMELKKEIKSMKEQQKSLIGLFADGVCPEGWTKTKWPYRKPIDNCADENCKMISVKELPGYIACEKN